MHLWRTEFELDGINSGSWYHCPCWPLNNWSADNVVAKLGAHLRTLQQHEMYRVPYQQPGGGQREGSGPTAGHRANTTKVGWTYPDWRRGRDILK